MTHPPRLLQRLIEALLPPSRREHILGDLEERYRSSASGGTLGYLRDVAHVLPLLMADQLKRAFSNWPCPSNRVTLLSASADLRVRAEAYQDYIWNRNFHAIFSALIILAAGLVTPILLVASIPGSAFDLRWALADAGNIALAIGWACGTYQLYFRRGHANSIPPGLSPEELRDFQRGELRRQMNIHWNLFAYWILPGPLFLVAYGATIRPAPFLFSGLLMLAAILFAAHITGLKRRRERIEFEKELARLERESVKAVS